MQYQQNEKIIIDKRKLETLIRLGCPEQNLVQKIIYGKMIPTGDSLIDDNLESLTDIKIFKNWGGSRIGAGRKSNENKELNQDEFQDENQVDNQLENQDVIQVVDKDIDKDKEKKNNIIKGVKGEKEKKEKTISDDHMIVAETIKGIEQSKHSKEISKQTLNQWADEIRKLEQIDKVPISRIIEIAKWYAGHFNDNKYMPVVESGRTFREKFGKLESAYSRSNPELSRPKTPEEVFDNIGWVLETEAEQNGGQLTQDTIDFVNDLLGRK